MRLYDLRCYGKEERAIDIIPGRAVVRISRGQVLGLKREEENCKDLYVIWEHWNRLGKWIGLYIPAGWSFYVRPIRKDGDRYMGMVPGNTKYAVLGDEFNSYLRKCRWWPRDMLDRGKEKLT